MTAARKLERHRRSIFQPSNGVGGCAYPGLAAQSSSTLKGLLPTCRRRNGRCSAAGRKAPEGWRTPRRWRICRAPRTGRGIFGLRWQAKRDTAFARPQIHSCSIAFPPPESAVAAALCRRTPRRWRECPVPPLARSVLECGGPPPLWQGAWILHVLSRSRRGSFRFNPFRIGVISRHRPRVAPAAQPLLAGGWNAVGVQPLPKPESNL